MKGDIQKYLSRLAIPQFLRFAQSLQSDRRARDRWGVFFIEGVRNFIAAQDHGWSIEAVVYSERLLISGIARSKVRRLRRAGVRTFRLSPEEFRILSKARNSSGIAAIVQQRAGSLDTGYIHEATCWLVVDKIESSGNLGTLLRTSKAVGGAGLILLGQKTDPYCPVLVRSSMGALFSQQFLHTSYLELKDWLSRRHLQVVGASPDAPITHFDFLFEKPCLIALGNERKGLSPGLADLCTDFVRIPMTEGIDSLNVSVAGSLLMYETTRIGK